MHINLMLSYINTHLPGGERGVGAGMEKNNIKGKSSRGKDR